jgi:hypothetical protein
MVQYQSVTMIPSNESTKTTTTSTSRSEDDSSKIPIDHTNDIIKIYHINENNNESTTTTATTKRTNIKL